MECLFLSLLMAHAVLCLQHKITIIPNNPNIFLGEALNLVCTATCPGSELNWITLDEVDAKISHEDQRSVLHISSASLWHNGYYTCFSICGANKKTKRVKVTVVSFPNAFISLEPEEPVSGQPFRVTCSVANVHPPDSLTLVLLDGDIPLTGEPQIEDNDNTQGYTLTVEQQHTTRDAEYTCETKLQLPDGSVFTKTAKQHVHFREIPKITEMSVITTALLDLTASSTREPMTLTSVRDSRMVLETRPPRERLPERGDMMIVRGATGQSVELSTQATEVTEAELSDSTPLEEDRSTETAPLKKDDLGSRSSVAVLSGSLLACVTSLAILVFIIWQKRKPSSAAWSQPGTPPPPYSHPTPAQFCREPQ